MQQVQVPVALLDSSGNAIVDGSGNALIYYVIALIPAPPVHHPPMWRLLG